MRVKDVKDKSSREHLIQNFVLEKGMSREDAEAAAKDMLSKIPPKRNSRADDRCYVKRLCKRLWDSGRRQISPHDVAAEFEKVTGKTRDPKSMGDLLGRGRGGLYLKKAKADGKIHYVIPDPTCEQQWYAGQGIYLSTAYYGDEELTELRLRESHRKSSTFFKERNDELTALRRQETCSNHDESAIQTDVNAIQQALQDPSI